MTNFWDALDLLEESEHKDFEYRLYYDDDGKPLFYTTEDEPGNYIVVTKEQYTVSDYSVTVVDGKIRYQPKVKFVKLVPGQTGMLTTESDVSIIATELGQYWNLTSYE